MFGAPRDNGNSSGDSLAPTQAHAEHCPGGTKEPRYITPTRAVILPLLRSFSFFFILLCNKQSRQMREINNGEVQEQKYYKRIQ